MPDKVRRPVEKCARAPYLGEHAFGRRTYLRLALPEPLVCVSLVAAFQSLEPGPFLAPTSATILPSASAFNSKLVSVMQQSFSNRLLDSSLLANSDTQTKDSRNPKPTNCNEVSHRHKSQQERLTVGQRRVGQIQNR